MANVLIAGGTGGIGLCLAKLMAGDGFDIYLIGRNDEKLSSLKEQMPAIKGTLTADLSDTCSLAGLAADFCASVPFDAFAYCAGITRNESLRRASYESNVQMFNVNYFSFLELLRLCLRKRDESRLLRVAAISSIATFRAMNYSANYSATKGALDSFVRSACLELLKRNCLINAVQPAFTDTPMTDRLRTAMGEHFDGWLEAMQPWGLIDPMDPAFEMRYLLTDAPLSITGTSRIVNGALG